MTTWLPRALRQQLCILTSCGSKRNLRGLGQPCRRAYSASKGDAPPRKLADIDPSKLSVTKTNTPSDPLPSDKLEFGRTFTDHMLAIEWKASHGWLAPRIEPYKGLTLDPATCVFHYAFACFEGMKAYSDANGQVRLFRPEMNLTRFNKSSARVSLPTFDSKALLSLIEEFVRLDKRFVPADRGYSLYIRPTMIGTERALGIRPPSSALLYVIASPVGPYYPTGLKSATLKTTDDKIRAWPGGVGDVKISSNYAPSVAPQVQAASEGYQQNLWLFGEEESITELGAMNFFAVLKDAQSGGKELVTPPLDGTILEGVTRDSILALARERLQPKGWKISERKITMGELAAASDAGRLLEIFGTGTASAISPVRSISWKGRKVECAMEEDVEAGPVTQQFKEWIEAIQYGEEPDHPWSHVI